MTSKPPRLVLRFAVYAAIPLVLAAIAIVGLSRHYATERAQDAVGFRARSLAYTTLRDHLGPADFAAPVGGARRLELDALFTRQVLVEGSGTVRVKLWSPDGRVAYSSVHSLIGTTEAGEHGVPAALRGESVLEVTKIRPDNGIGARRRVLEAYVPVRLTSGVHPSGVLEVDEDYAPVAREIRQTVVPVTIALALALLGVYALLFPILRRVTRSLELHNRRLADQATALQEKTDFVELLQVTAVAANEAGTVEEAVRVCLDAVCSRTGWPIGHAYFTDADSGQLAPSTIWHIADAKRFGSFRAVTEQTRLSAGLGLPGRALAEGKPVWLTKVNADTNFPRAVEARRIGIQSGFAFPVLVGAEVAAVLEFFSTEDVAPDEPLLEVMAHVGAQLGRVLERQRAEAALRASEERFRTIFERAAHGIVIADAGGRPLAANPAFQQMLDRTEEELRSLTFADFTHADDAAATAGHDERRFMTSGGETVWGRVASTAVPAADGERGFEIVMVEDISERKLLEDQLRQSQKMEAIGQLAGGVAHDFNNLLMVITGYSEVLLSSIAVDDPLRPRVANIKSAADRAASLTGQLLAFSRRQVLQPARLDLSEIVAETNAMLTRLIGEDIELTTIADPGLGVVRADRGQIGQVILNLCVNARDAMPEGGKLTIETANVTLEKPVVHEHFSIEPGRYVTVAVRDTGHGIDAATRAKVFEPFFTTKEPGRGTGLGLATVYGIVKQSGGYICVDSDPGRGAAFAVYLPRVDETADPLPRSSTGTDLLPGKETVLLVEDETVVRKLVREILERDGYAVLEAVGGHHAVEICEGHEGPIDLLISDVVMPGMSGPALAERIADLRPQMKVVFISGYTDDALDRRGALQPGTVFLQKPFTVDALGRTVRDVLIAS